jgi:uncharacterized protein (DUF2267 family)
VEQAAALGAQLSRSVRGFYFENWHPYGKPVKERKKEEFLAHIAAALLPDATTNAEGVTRAVFEVVARHVTPGAITHVKLALPAEIRSLWPEATGANA